MASEELKLDVEEFDKLLNISARPRVKEALTRAKAEVEREIINHEMKQRIIAERQSASNIRYLVELTEYAWDQSEKFVKLFITVNGVQQVAEDAVTLKLTENSMVLNVLNLNNKDYGLTVNNLLHEIDVEKCYRKIKNDMVAIYLKKKVDGQQWTHLTTIQHRLNQKRDIDLAHDASNPEAGLMNIMKKMYNDGDSKTKQMIAKAWTESQDKSRGDS